MMKQYAARHTPTQEESTSAVTPTEPKQEAAPASENELTDIGFLQIRVSTENQAFPIQGSTVSVTSDRDGAAQLEKVYITDSSGLTPLIELPTKNRNLSLSPSAIVPYAVYNLDVSADGYFPKRFVDLPIYGGVTAIQNVSMIPLPESSGDDIALLYSKQEPSL
ncbi:MAG: hypothetical protein IKV35_02895 [Clostridia bacterium]|nr:hypothetical protein [Clostridia bacterium]